MKSQTLGESVDIQATDVDRDGGEYLWNIYIEKEKIDDLVIALLHEKNRDNEDENQVGLTVDRKRKNVVVRSCRYIDETHSKFIRRNKVASYVEDKDVVILSDMNEELGIPNNVIAFELRRLGWHRSSRWREEPRGDTVYERR